MNVNLKDNKVTFKDQSYLVWSIDYMKMMIQDKNFKSILRN